MSSPTAARPLTDHGFALLEAELRVVMDAFGAVLRRLGEAPLADRLPWSGRELPAAAGPDRALGQAYSVAFQMLNLVEERVALQVRRLRENRQGPAAEPGLWPHKLAEIRALGCGQAEILETLAQVRVEPVLTAHPTEAKRDTVRERHRELYDLLENHENPAFTPREKQRIRRLLEGELEVLWRTGEIHVNRPSLLRELDTALFYLREVFPEVVARVHTHLCEAWEEAGWDPAALDRLPPNLVFGTWIGGDRDGHPGVSPEITRNALAALRANALRLHARLLEQLAYALPLSRHCQAVPQALLERIGRLAEDLEGGPGCDLPALVREHREEPWRLAARLIQAKLHVTRDHPEAAGAYPAPATLDADLALLAATLAEAGASTAVVARVARVRRQLATFGFHGARLDIRQNSAFHDRALGQLLAAAGETDGAGYPAWPEERKLALLERELASPRPFLAPGLRAGAEADAVVGALQVVAAHRARHGGDGLGALIVSMTRGPADLLAVYLLAREAGLLESTADGWRCPMPVTPLFETIADLENAPRVVEAFLSHPISRRSLGMGAAGARADYQMMIGYSDSNKDCGILASQCALHRAQRDLAATCELHGLRPVFFHGRGGTVGRGAGPTHWFMQALPQGSFGGSFRMTEQGETVAQKYAHLGSAVYHTELLVASAAARTARRRCPAPQPAADTLHDRLAVASKSAYRGLLESPGFLDFYRQATPIDALENARIGSRPARRTGRATFEDLRAIPWVFSWTQARFYLPGWFGTGSALAALREGGGEAWDELQRRLPGDGFLRYVFTNIDGALASANPGIMAAYAGLVADGALRGRFLGLILDEFARARDLLAELFDGPFAARRPRLARTLAIREEALAVLHHQQIALLREWRGSAAAGDAKAAEAFIPDLLVSVNAIASGLRNTG
jgi:phosphoenolpyruvate carboxylase